MTETLSLIQFQSPWQGRKGFARFSMEHDTGRVIPSGSVKTKKMLKKGKGGIDGIILQPAWATTRRLCVLLSDDTLHLHEVVGGRIDLNVAPIDISDPDFSASAKERLLYRRFVFANATHQIAFSDFEGRLLGPERTAFDIFPTRDFSPFARLMRMIDDPATRRKLIEDLKNQRFEYPDWVEDDQNITLSSAFSAVN